MSPIDVVVPVYRDVELTARCLDSVLAVSGARLGRLIIVDDAGPEPAMRPMLEALRARAPSVRLLVNAQNEGFVRACNRGLAASRGDVVVLNSDTQVTPGWLDELAAALEADELIAAACPLSNNATLCSVPRWGQATPASQVDPARLGTSGLARFTDLPTGVGFCMLMRREVLATVGPFDEVYGRGYNEENDWCQRARAAGYRVVRANRAFVFHAGEVSFAGEKSELDRYNARRLVARYDAYLEDNSDFEHSLDAPLAAIAVRAQQLGVRVAVVEGDEGPWVELVSESLRAALRASNVEVADAEPELVVLVGTPRLEHLSEFLSLPAHLVWAPGDLAHVDGRPLGVPVHEAQSRRAAAAVLAGSVTTWLGSRREAVRLEQLVGHLARAVVAPPDFSGPGIERASWVMPSASCSPAELGLLIERWAVARPPGARLELWVPAARVPRGWRRRLTALNIEAVAPRQDRAALLRGSLGVALPRERAVVSPEARIARAGGVPVIEIGPGARFDAPPSPPAPPEPFDWRGELRRVCGGDHPQTVARRRAGDVLAVLTRHLSGRS